MIVRDFSVILFDEFLNYLKLTVVHSDGNNHSCKLLYSRSKKETAGLEMTHV